MPPKRSTASCTALAESAGSAAFIRRVATRSPLASSSRAKSARPVAVQVGEHHRGAVLIEQPCHFAADATVGTRQQQDAIVEIVHGRCLRKSAWVHGPRNARQMFVLQVNAEKTTDLHDLAIDHVLSMVNAQPRSRAAANRGVSPARITASQTRASARRVLGVQRQGIVVLEAQGGGVDDHVEVLRIAVAGA